WGLLDPDGAGFLVRGRVVGSSSGYLVRAYDKDMRSEELLGEAPIDESGNFEIAYRSDQFTRTEKQAADLRLTVLNDAGREVVSAPIIFNAAPIEVVPDIALPSGGPAEYTLLTSELA